MNLVYFLFFIFYFFLQQDANESIQLENNNCLLKKLNLNHFQLSSQLSFFFFFWYFFFHEIQKELFFIECFFFVVFLRSKWKVGGMSGRNCFASESSDGENCWKIRLLRIYLQFSLHFITKTIDKLVLEMFNCSLLDNDYTSLLILNSF